MRRPVARSLLLGVALSAALASPGHAGWSADGATILSSTATLAPLAACSDAGYGTIIVWHEGVLRAQHVLASGDVDPAWPGAGVLLCDTLVGRTALGATSDGLGGAYVWWMEGAQIYLTRLDPNGARASAWPARGRLLGTMTTSIAARPSVISDGAHGIYFAWPYFSGSSSIRVMHLGPENVGAGGWPNTTRTLSSPSFDKTLHMWPQFALAPDGGVFLAWAEWNLENVYDEPGAWRLNRFTPSGNRASGWPIRGVNFGPFEFDFDWLPAQASLLALSQDARGGAFMMIGNPTPPDYPSYPPNLETRLYRLLGDGSSAPDWPAEGRVISAGPGAYRKSPAGASYEVLPDGFDGAMVGFLYLYVHGDVFRYHRVTSDGVYDTWNSTGGSPYSHPVVPKGDGGVYCASFEPFGPSGWYDDYASLGVGATPAAPGWCGFGEYHTEPVIHWYGDIALAPTGDGGAVFFWSQLNERFGLFARRFNTSGQLVAVNPGTSASALSGLRFIAGEGVRARVSFAGDARLELFDVSGRRVAMRRFDDGIQGASDVVIPGTASLPAGLYFARLGDRLGDFKGRVIVSR